MAILGIEKWYFHALVPVLGYYLSTLALNYAKKIFQK